MTDNGWLCRNHPFGHEWINRPFPNQGIHCRNCGITPEAAKEPNPHIRRKEAS